MRKSQVWARRLRKCALQYYGITSDLVNQIGEIVRTNLVPLRELDTTRA